jgi:nucleotide sugar dehydrogenase
MTITVVGLGKIGLPLAVQFARKGQKVLGADINQTTVNTVNKGLEPFPEEENLAEYLMEVVNSGLLQAKTSTTECVRESNVVVVVVPLFVDEKAEPDFGAMDEATRDVAKGLQRGTLVAYETTLPIGTTRNRFTKILEEESGLNAGFDFSVVFSPERVLTGRVFKDLRKYPKIVGGLTPKCAQLGREFYESTLDFEIREDLPKPNGVWTVETLEAAEFVKIAETTYRDVNIALANQFSLHANNHQINIQEVIAAANTQPYSHILQPGVSVGGHCIPIYPQFYLWNDHEATIVREARKINQEMPKKVIFDVAAKVGNLERKRIAILGISYRPKVKESAFSGIFEIDKLLKQLGAKTFAHDPFYSSEEIQALGLTPLWEFEDVDIVMIHTEHADYTEDFMRLFGEEVKIFNMRSGLFSWNLENRK